MRSKWSVSRSIARIVLLSLSLVGGCWSRGKNIDLMEGSWSLQYGHGGSGGGGGKVPLIDGSRRGHGVVSTLLLGAVGLILALIQSHKIREKRRLQAEEDFVRKARNEDILAEIRRATRPEEGDTRADGEVSGQGSGKLGGAELVVCLRCLDILARRCADKKKQIQQRQQQPTNSNQHANEPLHLEAETTEESPHLTQNLERSCQEAAFTVLSAYPNHDRALADAFALLALIGGNPSVRKLCTSRFALQVPISAMNRALQRTKRQHTPHATNNNTHAQTQPQTTTPTNEDQEQLAADLQRKGCLLLGSFADGNKSIATYIVDNAGLDAVLDAADWFRCHQDVVTWALWATFTLCYDHLANKGHLVQAGGVQRICRLMRDVHDSMEVQRHGIAILFDLMREMPGTAADLAKIRIVALNAGLHEAVKGSMLKFSSCREIMLMGRQMLVATGYLGEIPKFAK